MKNCNTILAEKQQKYQLYRLEKIDRYEFFTGEEVLPPGQRRVIKQAKFAYSLFFIIIIIFFSIWIFFHEHSRITRLQRNGEGISLTPHYYFNPLHRHLDISWAITAESSPLHIASSRTQTGNLWFPSSSC